MADDNSGSDSDSDHPLFEATAIHEYKALEATELSVSKGETITISEVNKSGWCLARSHTRNSSGWLPLSYVKRIPAKNSASARKSAQSNNSNASAASKADANTVLLPLPSDSDDDNNDNDTPQKDNAAQKPKGNAVVDQAAEDAAVVAEAEEDVKATLAKLELLVCVCVCVCL